MKKTRIRITALAAVIVMIVMLLPISNAQSVQAAESWLWPVPATTNTNGGRGYSSAHDGLDILAYLGAPVVATKSGTVYMVLRNGTDYPNNHDYGNGVIIHTTDGYYVHYAHLNSVSVTEGASIVRGQQVGTMGKTGNATGVHLHFAIAKGSQAPYGAGDRINNNVGVINYSYDYSGAGGSSGGSGGGAAASGIPGQIWTNGDFYGTIDVAGEYRLAVDKKNVWAQTYLEPARSSSGNPVFTNQLFYFKQQTDGSYMISSEYWNGFEGKQWYLQANNAGTTEGTSVNLWSSTGSAAQKWYYYFDPDLTNGFKHTFVNGNCSLVLGVQGDTIKTGAKMGLSKYDGGMPDHTVMPGGATYSGKPSKPAACSITTTENIAAGRTTRLEWNMADKTSDGTTISDERSYKLQILDSDGNVVLDKAGIEYPYYDFVFEEGGSYSVQVTSVNECYYNYETAGPVITISVNSYNDETKPTIQSVKLIEQTDDQVIFEIKATDDVAVTKITDYLLSAYGTYGRDQDHGVMAFGSAVTYSPIVDGTCRATISKQKAKGCLAGDRHGICFIASDAMGNRSERTDFYSFDLVVSPHITMNLGDTISLDDLTGVPNGIWDLFKPDNYVLSFEGYNSSSDAFFSMEGDKVFTAAREGTGLYAFYKDPSSEMYGAVVTVIDPSKVSIKNAVISGLTDQTYTGSRICPTPVVKLTADGTTVTLKNGDDYSVSYQNNIFTGTATIVITGKGQYSGTASATFAIKPASVQIPSAAVGLVENGTTQTGVQAGENYTITQNTATAKGEYIAVATLIDPQNYVWDDGTIEPKSIKWSIAEDEGGNSEHPDKVSIRHAEIMGLNTVTYNGKAHKPQPIVVVNDKLLKKEQDYVLAYTNNINAGTAKILIFGDGNYTGRAEATFKIKKAANPLKVKAKTATVKLSKLKRKNQKLAVSKYLKFIKAGNGKLTYMKASGNKKIAIKKTSGKMIVKKGMRKGTYKIKVKINAAGGGNYNKVTKTVTVNVKVK